MRVFPEVDWALVRQFQEWQLEMQLGSGAAALDPLTPLMWWQHKPGFGNEHQPI